MKGEIKNEYQTCTFKDLNEEVELVNETASLPRNRKIKKCHRNKRKRKFQ